MLLAERQTHCRALACVLPELVWLCGCLQAGWKSHSQNVCLWECVNYGREDSLLSFSALIKKKMMLFSSLLESLSLPLVQYS